MREFDLIIIGGGAGAFAAAIRADELKARTAMINSGLPMGGTCVNVGTDPSKTLLYAAEVLHFAGHHGVPGIELDVRRFSFSQVIKDEISLMDCLREGKYEGVMRGLKNVEYIEGRAVFVSENEVETNGQRLKAGRFIIATGSTAGVPPIEGISETGYVTHVEALNMERQPGEMAVIGAGVTGIEFAQMYSRFGTKITVLHHGDRILHSTEPELAEKLAGILQGEGIRMQGGSEIKSVRKAGGKKIISFAAGGTEEELAVDEILMASGKKPNSSGLGLDRTNVSVDAHGAITVNEFLQTSVPHIYAIGDVNNMPMRLESTAGREGTLAAENAMTGSRNGIDYKTVPYTIFTDPQFAGVGATAEFRRKTDKKVDFRTISLKEVPKAVIMRRMEGFIKMVIDPADKKILGVHMLAPGAGEVIAQCMMLVKYGSTIADVINTLPMFPTMAEGIRLAALSFERNISNISCYI